ncbi:MAG: helix-turn-helix domain-containing protein, partial [Oscillospiraceae bacterium]|nr:helix-turn-helix domain-containing protein [Oscillospiraceae bacterium]
MQNHAAVGQIISGLRKARGTTQEELASAVGISAQAVSKWENGGTPDTELL